METVLLLALMCGANIFCFIIGARVGQKAGKGEPIELPKVNPVQAVRESSERREARMEQERIDTILRNIENYDGTGAGQEDVPGR